MENTTKKRKLTPECTLTDVMNIPDLAWLLCTYLPYASVAIMHGFFPNAKSRFPLSQVDMVYWMRRVAKRMDLNTDMFKFLLEKCVITGSFLLAALYDAEWDDIGDIDILLKLDVAEIHIEFGIKVHPVENELYHFIGDKKIYTTGHNIDPETDDTEDYRATIIHLDFIRNYYVLSNSRDKTHKIQLLGSELSDFDSMVKDFDAGYVQNYFTGGKVVVKNINALMQKKTVIDLTRIPLNVCEDELYVCFYKFLTTRLLRFYKYEERGFHQTFYLNLEKCLKGNNTPKKFIHRWYDFWEERLNADGTLKRDMVLSQERLDELALELNPEK